MISRTLRYLRISAIAALIATYGMSAAVLANNMRILEPKPQIVEINNASHFAMVEFSFAWDNSWRTVDAPYNWDAAWVFMKWRRESESTAAWSHCILAPAIHHSIPAGFTTSQPSDNTGIFIYHSSNTSGPVTATLNNVRLRWDFSAQGPFPGGEKIEVRVFAVEMVYVLEGAFYVGSGGISTSKGALYKYDNLDVNNKAIPYFIDSENSIPVTNKKDSLYHEDWNQYGDRQGPIPASFPKGYRAFYCMKYEISQQQYVDFLNTLSRQQQNKRTEKDLSIGTTIVSEYFVMSNLNSVDRRSSIRCDAIIHESNPIEFYCDENNNGNGGDPDDGQSVAANRLNWGDLAAILDWMALRPMTELEFEKANRGTDVPVLDECSWGNNIAERIDGFLNKGTKNETSLYSSSNAHFNRNTYGPIRVGAFATASSTREQSGSSYYGIMELSGNVWERVISIGNPIGRSFTGDHGDGEISSEENNQGDANVVSWPPSHNAAPPYQNHNLFVGTGLRGGGYSYTEVYIRVADRTFGCPSWDTYMNVFGRNISIGGRGVRTLP